MCTNLEDITVLLTNFFSQQLQRYKNIPQCSQLIPVSIGDDQHLRAKHVFTISKCLSHWELNIIVLEGHIFMSKKLKIQNKLLENYLYTFSND